jgi:hypothetical protein
MEAADFQPTVGKVNAKVLTASSARFVERLILRRVVRCAKVEFSMPQGRLAMGRQVFYTSVIGLALMTSSEDAAAYNLFGPYPWGTGGETYYNKWGDIFHSGTPGGTITWSLMPDGTTIDPSFTDPNITGVSSLSSIMNGLGYDDALAALERCLTRWSTAANIYFVRVSDSGAPFNSAEAASPNTGQIRIGAFAIAGTVGAVGYAPPPNGGSLEGDVLLNSNSTFYFDSSMEGELVHIFNDFEGLLLHEIGHALGMAHSDVCAVMSVDFECYKYVNRELDPDDLLGIKFLYGPALKADFDHDNGVDAQDLATWSVGFGADSGAMQISGDANGDARIDGEDFLVWQQENGGGSAAITAVPEPMAFLQAAVIFAAMAAFRNAPSTHRT